MSPSPSAATATVVWLRQATLDWHGCSVPRDTGAGIRRGGAVGLSALADGTTLAMRSLSLDRTSPVPLYFQVAQHLEQAIDHGELPPGSLLLNEVDFAEALSLSRPTMRRAIQSLADKGLVVRRRGIGTRVVQPKMRRPLELTSLYDDLVRSGQKPSTEVLTFTLHRASQQIAERLAIDEGDEVLELVRLRLAGSEPIAVLTNFLPASVVRFDKEACDCQDSCRHAHSTAPTCGTPPLRPSLLLADDDSLRKTNIGRVHFPAQGTH